VSDPGDDGLFVKINCCECRCVLCGEVVENTTEARDAHLAQVPEPYAHTTLYEIGSVASTPAG
jgi:hypothetical protein